MPDRHLRHNVRLFPSASAVTITMSSTAASVPGGGNVTVPITFTRTGGFTGDITLMAENLPTGLTATFNPSTITSGRTTSTLTLNASSTATVGTAHVTVRASGSGVNSKPVILELQETIRTDNCVYGAQKAAATCQVTAAFCHCLL